MRRCRVNLPNRCYHLISRVAHRVYFRDEDERTCLVDWPDRHEWCSYATGLVTNKVYADGVGPTYAYTPDGKLALRTWARGVSTSYSYDGAGNLVSTTYSDGTPSIACAYDRSGNIVSAVTEGVATNLYAYSVEGLLTNEVQNGASLARSYDALGRPTGYTLSLCASATPREVSFSYPNEVLFCLAAEKLLRRYEVVEEAIFPYGQVEFAGIDQDGPYGTVARQFQPV